MHIGGASDLSYQLLFTTWHWDRYISPQLIVETDALSYEAKVMMILRQSFTTFGSVPLGFGPFMVFVDELWCWIVVVFLERGMRLPFSQRLLERKLM